MSAVEVQEEFDVFKEWAPGKLRTMESALSALTVTDEVRLLARDREDSWEAV